MKQPNIEYRAVSGLTPYGRNARTHSKKQIRQIADSIDRFGFTNPVLIDDDGMILAGHGRVAAAGHLGLKSVPCLRISSLTDTEKRAYILADNKLAQNAGWDHDLLAEELTFLLESPEEINVALTGFSIAEIDVLLEPGGTPAEADAGRDDIVPVLDTANHSTTRPGDVWLLGPHRLICGDARREDVYRRLMVKTPDARAATVLRTGAADSLTQDEHVHEFADMVFTDPPYNVPVDGHVCGSGKIKHREFACASGEMSPRQFTAFLRSTFEHLAKYTVSGSIHFICMDWRHMRELMDAGEDVYNELKNLIVWAKDMGGMGSFYRSRHELIFAFKNGAGEHVNTFELGQHGRTRTNVWNYRGVAAGSKEARKELALHPTVKPVAMLADALLDCCPRGGIVLDAFAGSGSIFIAAQKTGRRARTIELDPHYCDVAIRRWQDFAKDDAVLLTSGERFDDVARRCREDANAEQQTRQQCMN